MTIKFASSGNGKGYGNYILREGKNLSDAELQKIKVLSGDMSLGDEIIKSSNYKDNAFNVVLGFKGSITPEKAKQVTDDFQKLFMHGFSKNEYHLDAVLHQDVENHHVHIRIPKKNLYTDTTLRLYMDKVDRKRVNEIRDFLEIKHNLERVQDNLKLSPNISKEDIIQKHRVERGQEPFDFSKKKGRDKAQRQIITHIEELHQAELINNIDDVRAVLKKIGLEASEKQGHDFKTDTYYITATNETGKLSLKGELFNGRFYTEFEREDRQEQIRNNSNTRRAKRGNSNDYEEALKRVERTLFKRGQEVSQRYESQRERASQRYRAVQALQSRKDTRGAEQQQQPLQYHNTVANNTISSSIISNAQKLENGTMASASKVPTPERRREQVYTHTNERLRLYSRQQDSLRSNQRKINGITRDTTRGHGETEERERPERESSYESLRDSRESLYNQARGIVQDRAERRGRRERNRRAIDRIGTEFKELESTVSREYKEVDEQSECLIESAQELTRAVEQKLEPTQEQDYGNAPSM